MATIDSIPPELLTHEIFPRIGVENHYAVYSTCKRFRSLLKITHLTTTAEVYSGCVSGDLLGVILSQVVIDPNDGLSHACKGGHHEMVRYMIARGSTYWNSGLKGACQGGHHKLVLEMIDRGANQWDFGLYNAAKGGHWRIVREMIARGAAHWNWGLIGACRGGHLELVREMIARGAYNWNWALSGACRGGHKEIIREMIARGANRCDCCRNKRHPEL